MALVAYENSDSSEYDDGDDTTELVVLKKPEDLGTEQGINPVEDLFEVKSVEDKSLFNILPQPSSKRPEIIEEDDEFLHKKEINQTIKPKAKIMVPSLNDFKDVQESAPNAKPRNIAGKKSGLLNILPQPRNGVKTTTKAFIPNVLTQKTNNNLIEKKTLGMPLKTKIDPKPLVKEDSDNSDDDAETDFFSINKPQPEIPLDDSALQLESKETVKKPFNIEAYFKSDKVDNHFELHEDESDCINYSSEEHCNDNNTNRESTNNDIVLDEEAILKLCGARGKRKREEIQIVDVNQQEVLANAREMLMKGLMDDTTKRVSSSKRKGNEPTSQQKRKHQITYLAHQAKANEAELQNQWANNRMSRRQTQSKYGF